MRRILFRRYPFVAGILGCLCAIPSPAQVRIGTGGADRLYQQLCASCHGSDLRGGMSSSLVDDNWQFGESDADLARSVREGHPDLGMPGFGESLSEDQIRSLVIYMREAKHTEGREASKERHQPRDGVYTTEELSFRLEKVAEAPGILWAIAFLPDQSALVTQLDGKLWRLRDSELTGPIEDTPAVWHGGQGGLLDVLPHPDFAENGWVYLAFSHRLEERKGMTKVVRGRIENDRWSDEETIWEAPHELYLSTQHHYGSRIVLQDGYIYFSVGDRGRQNAAQDLSLPNGKIYRLHEDGSVPEDNPFLEETDALPGIWSYGHRNPQALAAHPKTRELWSTEHGPRGGDEVNLIHRGANYGWPVVTYGMNYDGTPITALTEAEGMTQPKLEWTPSIAPCGGSFYTGEAFAAWENNFFATGLSSEQLHRLVIENGEIAHEEVVLSGRGRLRDVVAGPDGLIYLAIDGPEENGKRGGLLYRMVPVKEEEKPEQDRPARD